MCGIVNNRIINGQPVNIIVTILVLLLLLIITWPRTAFNRLGLDGSSRGYSSNG